MEKSEDREKERGEILDYLPFPIEEKCGVQADRRGRSKGLPGGKGSFRGSKMEDEEHTLVYSRYPIFPAPPPI